MVSSKFSIKKESKKKINGTAFAQKSSHGMLAGCLHSTWAPIAVQERMAAATSGLHIACGAAQFSGSRTHWLLNARCAMSNEGRGRSNDGRETWRYISRFYELLRWNYKINIAMKNRQIYLTNIDANIILWKEILDPKNIAEKLNLSNLGQLTLHDFDLNLW